MSEDNYWYDRYLSVCDNNNYLTAQLDASQALLAERDKLIENQQAEIESRNQLRYDALKGEHSRSPYYYDSWCKLHDHKGVIGTSDKPPIHYAVNLLNRLTEQLAERDAVAAEKVVERARLADENAALREEVGRLKRDLATYVEANEKQNARIIELESFECSWCDKWRIKFENTRKHTAQRLVEIVKGYIGTDLIIRDIEKEFKLHE